MAKKFFAKYLGGHPASGKTGSVVLSATKKGIRVRDNRLIGSSNNFMIEWPNIISIDDKTERFIKNSGLLTGLGWMSGNPMMMLAGNNPTSGKNTFLVIEFEDNTGFKSSIIFHSDDAAKAKALFIYERGKHIKSPNNRQEMNVASSSPAIEQAPKGDNRDQSTQKESPGPIMTKAPEGSTPTRQRDNKQVWLLLGWIFLPYVMVPIYVFQNQSSIFVDKDPKKIGIAIAGTVWAVVSICIATFS